MLLPMLRIVKSNQNIHKWMIKCKDTSHSTDHDFNRYHGSTYHNDCETAL